MFYFLNIKDMTVLSLTRKLHSVELFNFKLDAAYSNIILYCVKLRKLVHM